MINIDWSKAPEFTIGALVTKKNNVHHPRVSFVLVAGLVGCNIRAISSVDRASLCAPSDCWEFVERPAEWTGEGLPPVGAMVEIRLMGWSIRESAEKFIGIPLRVAASFRMDCGTDMIAVDGGHDLGCEVFRAEMAVPARTPEQIAAEEREKAIAEMRAALPDWAAPENICPMLYDAGYRKVTP